MKIVIVALLLLAAAIGVYMLQRSRADVTSGKENPYEGLRSQALSVSATDVGLTVGPNETWGVLMDLPISDATTTVVAFADGTASIYLSSGGGFIGGGQRPPVRMAAQAFVKAAGIANDLFAPTTTYPLPQPGRIRFHIRVGNDVRTAEAAVPELESGRHPLSAVYAAGQAVITAYRETEA